MLGRQLGFPTILGPVGDRRLMHPEDEMAAARAAGQFGTAYIFSTISGHKLENMKAASNGPSKLDIPESCAPSKSSHRRRENSSSPRVSGGFSSESFLCGHAAELAEGKEQLTTADQRARGRAGQDAGIQYCYTL